MELDDNEELTECCNCGAPLVGMEHDAFRVEGALLCYDCAVQRGGILDRRQGRWIIEPDVSDLSDRRRPGPRDAEM